MFWRRVAQFAVLFGGIGAVPYLTRGIRALLHDASLKQPRKLLDVVPPVYLGAYILVHWGKKKQNPTKQNIIDIFTKLKMEFDPRDVDKMIAPTEYGRFVEYTETFLLSFPRVR
jgi:hypothetical protein